MLNILSSFPWNIQRKIIDYINNPILIEVKSKYTRNKLTYIAHLRENGELKYARFVNDAFKFKDVFYMPEIEWSWFELALRKVYNGERPWLQIIPTNYAYTFIEWLKKISKFKYAKYGFTSLTDYMNTLDTYK